MLSAACRGRRFAVSPCIDDPLWGRLLRVPALRRLLASRLPALRSAQALHVADYPFAFLIFNLLDLLRNLFFMPLSHYPNFSNNKAEEDFRTPYALRAKIFNGAERMECGSPLPLCYGMRLRNNAVEQPPMDFNSQHHAQLIESL